ncbi:hypothetical protein M436DRAFT_42777 [Aureobasidium namibiae CBS 147.97]|uniref:GIY-YIG domain-containing protein n=1 Tax=Aureobasidium namibiae CBS 147.97 TaxID=1043004 RepID=A0A074WP40_9PEZI|nr:uncharacterized protein M436DRAFT_42777 [Aureobasidium namibiae CBS 147.97]KEQ74900.1 hypothetical protein M436DRAFT_42777 [Aureobasidium namibiae CBS 147.97]
MDRPIPAFYACYLLRSTVRHQNLYVGSTPHPVRRLKQHNGIAKGGAVRTSKDTLRPWEMTCLVTGFPSKIAALQFEWAWQNTHQTRHIAPDERITQANTKQRFSPRTGKVRKRVGRPRMSMHDKLANLHILLRAKSFERWPLQVKFFAEDVFKMWHRWTVNMPEVIRQGIEIEMDESVLQRVSLEEDPSNLIGIHKIDPTYLHMKLTLEKSRKLLSAPNTSCIICRSALESAQDMVLVCSNQECDSIFHVACLSTHFLRAEHGAQDAIVPTCGYCPSCKVSLNWADLVKDLSLRVRGEKEVTALFKEPKRRKRSAKESTKSAAVTNHDEAEELDDVDQIQATPSGGDDWKLVDELDEQDTPGVVASTSSSAVKTRKAVIEDSDWDEAEVIE